MTRLFEPVFYGFNPEAGFYGVSGIVILVMGLFTVRRERDTRTGLLFLLYTISVSGWVVSLALVFMSLDMENALIWARLANASIAFLPAIFFHISVILLKLNHVRPHYIYLLWSLSSAFSFTAISNTGFVTGLYHYDWGTYGSYGHLGNLFIAYFFGTILYSIYIFAKSANQAEPGSKTRKRIGLLTASFIIGIFSTTDLLPSYGIDIQPIGAIFLLALFLVNTYVAYRYHLADIPAAYAAENIVNLINTPLFVIDTKNAVQLTNQAAERLFLITDKQDLVKTILPFVKNNISIEHLIDGNPVENIEFEYYLQGQAVCYSLSISPLLSNTKTLIAYIILLRDITVRKQSENFLKQARDNLEKMVLERTHQLQKEVEKHKQTAEELLTAKNLAESASQAKTEFLSRISHELRTPLNALLGLGQLLHLDVGEFKNPEHKVYIEQILKSGEHLHDLIEDILDLSRLDMNKIKINIENVDVIQIIDEVIKLIDQSAKIRGINIENNVPNTNRSLILTDTKRFKQIIVNLATNAVKYNRDGGKIVFDCKEENGKCSILIRDTGIGISLNDQERIFEPFEKLDDWRHHTGGAGIGLTLSRRLARQMNGNLTLTSKPGTGSEFCLEMPLEIS